MLVATLDTSTRTRLEALLEKAQPRFLEPVPGMMSNQELFYRGPDLDLFDGTVELMRSEWGLDVRREDGCHSIEEVCQQAEEDHLMQFLLAAWGHISRAAKAAGPSVTPISPDEFVRRTNSILEAGGFFRRLAPPRVINVPDAENAVGVPDDDEPEEETTMSVSIFISHSSEDLALATALVEFLEAAFVIPPDTIRCTSVPGYKLMSGAHTSTTLRAELSGATAVIGVLTPRSIASGWVLFELGASWGLQKWVVPLLAGGASFGDLPGPLHESHGIRVSERSDLEQLIDEIASHLPLTPRPRAATGRTIEQLRTGTW